MNERARRAMHARHLAHRARLVRSQVGRLIHAMGHPAGRRALRWGVAATGGPQPMLRRVRPSYVLDVGANRGQFALDVLAACPGAEIVSVEPIPREAAVLRRVLARVPAAQVVEAALGAEPGDAELNVLAASDSSSILPASARQSDEFPGMGVVETITVPVLTVGSVLGDRLVPSPALLKLDVQGYELEVLKGARNRLADFDYVYVELSYVELYVGQPLATDVIQFLVDQGFTIDDAGEPTRRSGRALQQDFLFRRGAVRSADQPSMS